MLTIPPAWLREDDATPVLGRRKFLRAAVSGAALLGVSSLFPGLRPACGASPQDVAAPDCAPAIHDALSAANAGMFLLFSDVHFDPFADPGKVKALAAAPAGEWRDILSGAQSALSPYGQDASNALFQSFLDDMALHAPRPDFLLFPGDLLCHHFWTLYPRLTGDASPEGLLAFITKTADYFLTETTRRFPGAPLYLALGNNDSFEGDFRIEPHSPYLSATAPLVARLALKEETARRSFLETYPAYGCYSTSLPVPGNGRLIVFNNIFWAKHSPRQDAGGPVLEYLERELELAERAGETVWLMTHVPPGDNSKASAAKFLKTGRDVYAPLLVDRFNDALARLLVKYASTIRAGFAGHVHRDEFRLVYPHDGGDPAVSLRLGPSISPITGNNPGYQIYSYDKRSLALVDMTTRYLNLGASAPAWAEEYRYAEAYGRGLRSPNDWRIMYQDLKTCPARRKTFAESFDLRSAHIDEVTGETFPIFWDGLSLSAGSGG